MRDQKHNFAFYYAQLDANLKSAGKLTMTISDPELVQRVTKILRLQVGDELILFAKRQSITGVINLIDKKSFSLEQISWHQVVSLVPEINVALGVLKKENFENALYSCVELGANHISPVIFAKSAPQKLNPERLEKILISAAEQSKNFNLPHWQEPVSFAIFLEKIRQNPQITYIYCDVLGDSMWQVVAKIKTQACTKMVLIVGPEGDLTTQEKELLAAQPNVLVMRLTPTILRSFQAVAVALGAFRSLLN
jgi:16S rRNA (uracil1498-N3)-methyltransferase